MNSVAKIIVNFLISIVPVATLGDVYIWLGLGAGQYADMIANAPPDDDMCQ